MRSWIVFATACAGAACAKGVDDEAGAVLVAADDASADGRSEASADARSDVPHAEASVDASLDADVDGDVDVDVNGDGDGDDVAVDAAVDAGADVNLDAPAPDAPPSDGGPLGPPCLYATGWTAWRFHYDQSHGTTAVLDVYSLPDKSNWSVSTFVATQFVDAAHGGGVDIDLNNEIDVAYSVVGITTITKATLSVYGRSYDASLDASFDASPLLYSDVASPTNSVKHTWPYAAVSVDYTGRVKPGDPPGSTGVAVLSGPTSNVLVVGAVELCMQGH